MHVEQVLGDVPPPERCRCREETAKAAGTPTASGIYARLRGLFTR
jgi:hypothetical protein